MKLFATNNFKLRKKNEIQDCAKIKKYKKTLTIIFFVYQNLKKQK